MAVQQRRATALPAAAASKDPDKWTTTTSHNNDPPLPGVTLLEKEDAPTTTTTTTLAQAADALLLIDEDAPAGIVGAQFFGGNKQKEEFYDPVAEAEATVVTTHRQEICRFDDRTAAFDSDWVAGVAKDLQHQFNTAAGTKEDDSTANEKSTYQYADTVQWDTPFQVPTLSASSTTTTPLAALAHARTHFFRSAAHVAITAGRTLVEAPSALELRWELSLVWPTVWEPRVLVTGTSRLTLQPLSHDENENDDQVYYKITKQVDRLDAPDLYATLQQQILPRFWDLYHIGMTPCAEVSPRLPVDLSKSKTNASSWWPWSSYQITELPPRWVLQPTLLDTGVRDDVTALMVPNHAFACVIKTMGPTKQQYTPTHGVQVQLLPPTSSSTTSNARFWQWSIPLAVEYAAQPVWTLPLEDDNESGDDDNNDNNNNNEADITKNIKNTKQTSTTTTTASCRIVYEPRRRIATLPYGGDPQDESVAAVRQALYEQVVVRDGHHPKTTNNEDGRPVFFFIQNSIKACYTNEGLGMAVYEWRPEFTRPNEVGIELELENEAKLTL